MGNYQDNVNKQPMVYIAWNQGNRSKMRKIRDRIQQNSVSDMGLPHGISHKIHTQISEMGTKTPPQVHITGVLCDVWIRIADAHIIAGDLGPFQSKNQEVITGWVSKHCSELIEEWNHVAAHNESFRCQMIEEIWDYSKDVPRDPINFKFQKGDILIIPSMDYIGQNLSDIFKVWKYLVQDIGMDVLVLDLLSDDDDPVRILNDDIKRVSDVIKKTFLYVIEKEREKYRIRQRLGIDKARLEGKYKGRKPKEFDEELLRSECSKWHNNEQTAIQTYRNCGLSKSFFYAKIKELGISKPKK